MSIELVSMRTRNELLPEITQLSTRLPMVLCLLSGLCSPNKNLTRIHLFILMALNLNLDDNERQVRKKIKVVQSVMGPSAKP